ncbi:MULTISPECIES: AAA family ATPase [Brevibacillus]|uniref:AAA family ATPase n=1 Tax=Brevibacillus TaxID=55080 RepID=UPI000ED6D78A|nr:MULTISPECIES: AAA family ATPase [Brevibacillus]MBU8711297.1 AAA family ATPase [Brevibacillus parabrevis]MDR4999529.1 AAA family ATPase [Brevibacillus parabrevis]MED2253910.1 AAA family ATPase [Brevibacillus parabrevis]UED66880.1 AAA family ATPase [Brevibacillus sp. HD3.3A]WDV93131.1 AAA family ATPase [Brevibacillus parabrevis]
MKQAGASSAADVHESSSSSNRIQVVFNRPLRIKQPNTLAEIVRASASANLASVFDELENLIGLHEAKKTIYEIYALIKMNKEREKHGLKIEKQVFHMVFKGNPGTGKTTIARLFGKIFKEMGVLSKGHLIEVERADLVGEFIGHTAQKTRDLVKKALGGILFIDEAYSLARGGEKDFGKEAIDCLTKSLEDYGNEFVCIIAGYNEEMDSFLELNPGMPSRFPVHIKFTDYDADELMEIAHLMSKNKEYELSKDASEKLRRRVTAALNDPFVENFSNARFVRNNIEKAIRVQAVRLLKVYEPTKEDLLTLKSEDFTI